MEGLPELYANFIKNLEETLKSSKHLETGSDMSECIKIINKQIEKITELSGVPHIPESSSSFSNKRKSGEDDSPIFNRRKKKVKAIISDDEDDVEEVCSYSPRKRKSIKGVRQIYSSDESPDFRSDDNVEYNNTHCNTIEPRFKGKIGLANFNAGKALTIDRLKDMPGSLETCPISSTLAEQPFGIQVPLMRHQLHAIAWMTWRESQKPRGGVLADDMGLGKTLTVISLVLSLKHRKENIDDGSNGIDNDDDDGINNGWSAKGRRDYHKGNNLVICPSSLIGQWEKEIKQHCKKNLLSILVYHGTNRSRDPECLAKFDFVITTYKIASIEKKLPGAIFKIDWNRIILDEAHVICNPQTEKSKAVCALKGKYRWALTGTPIQNKEQDAYALLKFLKCSPFNDLANWKKLIDNKTADGRQIINTLMTSLMLRRTKIQLLEIGELQGLPEKDIQLIEVTLDENEWNVYSKIWYYFEALFQKTEAKSYQIILLLLRLRQICCHPGLINAMLEDETNQSVNDESNDCDENEIDLFHNLVLSSGTAEIDIPEKQTISKASSKVLSKLNPVFDLNVASSKIRKVLDVLYKCILNTDDKAVIVSEWPSVLNILAYHLDKSDIKHVSINGNVKVKDRQDIINDFNKVGSGPKVMLLSLTAGGVGFNLIGGNHLFLLNPHWNPQLEAQAQDRIYRVGQTKKVFIYKFICKDTVEQAIKVLQDKKLEIANGILTGSKVAGSNLSLDDLKSLFGM